VQIKVDGLAKLVNQLEKFSPEVSKALKSEMRSGAQIVAKEAQSRVPSVALTTWGAWTEAKSGRDLSFSGSAVKRGIKPVTNRYRRRSATVAFGYDVVSTTAPGNIYEVAGPGTRTTGPAGDAFVRNLNSAWGSGPLPRTLFPAYYAGIDRARAQIENAIRDAERKVGR